MALPRSPETDKALCELIAAQADADVAAAGRELRRRGGCPIEPLVEKLKSAPTVNGALSAIAMLGPTLKDLAPRVTPLLSSSDAATRKLVVDALIELGDPSAGPALLKAWEAEVKTLEPQRSDWVPTELPQHYAPGYDPDQSVDGEAPAAVMRQRTSELFRRVHALDAERARMLGKTRLLTAPSRSSSTTPRKISSRCWRRWAGRSADCSSTKRGRR